MRGEFQAGQRPKVAIYCRLSDEDHDKQNPLEDSRSIQTQKAMLSDYACRQGWEIFDIYSDDDFSGADADRPDYNRLLRDAGQGCFDIVLCKHQSRFTRDMVHVERYINEKFPQWGIRYISLLDGADTAVAGNKKSRQINGLVNEWYLEDLSENVRRAGITIKKQGKYLASCAVYGYQKDPRNRYHLIIDEPAAQIVRRIFQMCIEGYSLNRIARILNEEGVPSPTRYKTEVKGIHFRGTENLRKNRKFQGESLWQSSSVHRILTNETYMGDLYQNRQRTVSYKNHTRINLPKEQWIIVEHTHQPIVSRQEFALAARIRSSRPRVTIKGNSHLFTGKLVCGFCGGSVSFNSKKKENCYYRCHRRANLGKDVCRGVTIAERLLTQSVLKQLKKVFHGWMQREEKEYILSHIHLEEEDHISSLQVLLAEKKGTIQKLLERKTQLYQDFSDGLLTRQMYQELWEQFQKSQAAEEAEAERLKRELLWQQQREAAAKARQGKIRALAEEKLAGYLRCEVLTREMLDAFVDHIEVAEIIREGGKKQKKITVHWNF